MIKKIAELKKEKERNEKTIKTLKNKLTKKELSTILSKFE
jgi:predicted transcriptional regulator|tara:strand:+ start:648 stop:767 length:120 start_codon:yes stop_codon:yes gene_type:complete